MRRLLPFLMPALLPLAAAAQFELTVPPAQAQVTLA